MRRSLAAVAGMALFAMGGATSTELDPRGEGPAPRTTAPGQELSKVSFLLGRFTARSFVHTPEGKMGPITADINTDWGLDSTILITHYDATTTPLGPHRGLGVLTFDPEGKVYRYWWFDNWGQRSVREGGFVGDVLSLEGELRTSNGTQKQKLTWRKEGTGFEFRIFVDSGQGYGLFMEETATSVTAVKDGAVK